MDATETVSQMEHRCLNTTLFNCSVDEYLWVVMGPRRLALEKIVPISIVLVVIFLTGFIGNVAVCVVIVKHPAMRTATNYYLFSLAASDLLLLVFGLPNDLTVYWHQYPYSLGLGFCKLRALISEAASYVSVLTIVAFSLERYLAICHPLHLYTMAGLHRAVKIIGALWVVSLLAAVPFALNTDISYHEYPPNSKNITLESAFCAMLEQPWYLCEFSSLVFFIMPAFTMLYLYIRMGIRIRYVMWSRSGRQGNTGALNGVNGSVHGEERRAKSRKAVIRMLAAVVIAFFVCWAPFHFQRLFFIYGSGSPHYNDINEHLFNVAGTLYYVSATVNPILYNVMSNRYRVAFRETICCDPSPRQDSRFYRDQSSFRETTINQCSDSTQLVRVKSIGRDRRPKLNIRRHYPRSTSTSESRSSRIWENEFKHINNESEIKELINNNKGHDNKCVNFKTNSLNNINDTNDYVSIHKDTDRSKISLNVYVPNNTNKNKIICSRHITKTNKEFKKNDPVFALVSEITYDEPKCRQDLNLILEGSKSVDNIFLSPDFSLDYCNNVKAETNNLSLNETCI